MNPANRFCLLFSALACVTGLPALAQQSPPGATGSNPPTTTLPRMTVQDTDASSYTQPVASTGTGTDTPIMDTPLDIQAVTQQVMQDQQDTRIDQVLRNVSGVAFTGGGDTSFGNAFDEVVLRGFPTDSHLRDGIRLDTAGGDTELFTQQLANIESVEVLKGPAAVLYGAVEPGGVVNLITKQPQSTPSYQVQQQIGSYSSYRTVADATGPLDSAGALLYRIDASYEDSKSIVDLGFNRDLLIAPTLQLRPGESTTITLELEHKDANFNGNYSITPLVENAGGLFVPLNDNPHINYGEQSDVQERTDVATLRWSHDFNARWTLRQQIFADVVHNTGQQVTMSGLGPLDPANPASAPAIYRLSVPFDAVNHTYATTMDLTGHFDTAAVHHTLLVGGDWYRVENNSLLFNTNPNYAPNASLDSIISLLDPVHPGTPFAPAQFTNGSNGPIDSQGLNLQDQLSFADHWFALIGARYQHFYNDDLSYGLYGTSSPFGSRKVTPRFGLLWRPEQCLSLYASYANSWSPSEGEQLVTGGIAPNRQGRQKELGIKLETPDSRLSSTISIYDLTKTNIPNQDPANPGLYFLTGEVRSRGLEIDLTGQLSRGWKLIANFSDMDASIVVNNDPANPPGTQPSYAPRLIGNLWSTYEWKPTGQSTWTVGAGVNAQGPTPALNYSGVVASQTSDYTQVAGYTTFNAMAAWRLNAGAYRLHVQLNADNLTDKRYSSYIELTNPGPDSGAPTYTYNNVTYGYDRRLFGDPRIVRLEVGVQF